MIDKNLLLYLPFDDPDGAIAYDYSQNRQDASISDGARFDKNGKIYKALAFNGTGSAQTAQDLPLGSDFTLTCYIKPTGKRIGWMLNFEGVNKYIDQWLDVSPGEWTFLAFVKTEIYFKVYLNGYQVYNTQISGVPVGFSVNDEDLETTDVLIDEVRLYSRAMNESEISQMERGTDVEYYINGINFKEFGVNVSDSSGLVGRLQRKESLTVDWDGYHGIVRDKKRQRYKERTIELECFIEADGRSSYVQRVNDFLEQFDKDGTQRLKVEYDGTTKPLVYEVISKDDVDPKKKWSGYNSDLMVGTFKIKLVEDEPVKRVLRHIGATAETVAHIKLSTYKMVNVFWGDGTHQYNISGSDVDLNHTYAEPGEYEIIISGVVEEIQKFETNAIVLWNKLF